MQPARMKSMLEKIWKAGEEIGSGIYRKNRGIERGIRIIRRARALCGKKKFKL